MRWMIIALVVTLALIIDQLRFAGYYWFETVKAIDQDAVRIAQIFR